MSVTGVWCRRVGSRGGGAGIGRIGPVLGAMRIAIHGENGLEPSHRPRQPCLPLAPPQRHDLLSWERPSFCPFPGQCYNCGMYSSMPCKLQPSHGKVAAVNERRSIGFGSQRSAEWGVSRCYDRGRLPACFNSCPSCLGKVMFSSSLRHSRGHTGRSS